MLLPATVTVAVRLLALFAVTATTAVPDAVPPPVTLAHEVGDEALHEQPDGVLTATEAVPAALEKLNDVGDTV